CLTLVERTKAGTLDSGDMDEHVSAAVLGLNESIALGRVEPFDSASSHRRLLECTSGPHDHRATVHPKSALSWESIQGCATSNARFEPRDSTQSSRRVQQRESGRTRDKKFLPQGVSYVHQCPTRIR